MTRVVGHMDLDYFYAQVEEVEDPSLKTKPVLVCVFSGRTEDSGVVSTANYRARELGIHSGMPITVAKKKLEGKGSALIRMDRGKYEAVSSRIMEKVGKMVNVLEPRGIDEAFFDATSSTGGDFARARELAEAIRMAIYQSEGLTCSIGIGRSKVVAKLGSDSSKPDGMTVVFPQDTETFLGRFSVSKIYGIGPMTASALGEMSVVTVADLAKVIPSELEKRFGRKMGGYLLAAAKGTDDDPVVGGLEPTQFSRIITLRRDTRNPEEIISQLSTGIRFVHGRLAASAKVCRTVSAIGILTNLATKTRSKTFETPVEDERVIRETTFGLFQELSRSVELDFRRVGVRVAGLSSVEDQRSLSEYVGNVR